MELLALKTKLVMSTHFRRLHSRLQYQGGIQSHPGRSHLIHEVLPVHLLLNDLGR